VSAEAAPPESEACKVAGCKRELHALGYCQRHYQRLRRNGTTTKKVSPWRNMSGRFANRGLV
jgi:hypothetical protein